VQLFVAHAGGIHWQGWFSSPFLKRIWRMNKTPKVVPVPISVLRFPATKQRTGMSHSMTYDLIKKKEFPAPIRLGARGGLAVD
jgi:predicted DNA-binding transcriptional regulator AlpA